MARITPLNNAGGSIYSCRTASGKGNGIQGGITGRRGGIFRNYFRITLFSFNHNVYLGIFLHNHNDHSLIVSRGRERHEQMEMY